MLTYMSISGGALIFCIILLRPLAIHRLPKKVFVLLWDIALLRLLLPFWLPVHLGFAFPAVEITEHSASAFNAPGNLAIPSGTNAEMPDTATSYNPVLIWTVIWIVGMAILFATFTALYLRERRNIRTALPISKEQAAYLQSITEIPDAVKIFVSDQIATPMTFGIVSPKIIFPKIITFADSMDLKCVLTHELVHIRRADNLRKFILLAAVCVHWFNPLVWIMYVLFSHDMELACDEKVIALLGEGEKKHYAMALVNVAEQQHHWSFFSNEFGKNAVQERIAAIMKYKKATFITIGCTIFLLAGALTVFAQGGSGTSEKSDSRDNSAYIASREDDTDSTYSGDDADITASTVRSVANSEEFPSYEAYGLSLDSSGSHLMYEGEIVEYFKDETAAGTYTRILDSAGTIGLVVARDSDYQITGFIRTDSPDMRGGSAASEVPGTDVNDSMVCIGGFPATEHTDLCSEDEMVYINAEPVNSEDADETFRDYINAEPVNPK